MKVLVCGGRDCGGYEIPKFIEELDKYGITSIITGEAKGFDTLARLYAEVKGLEYKGYIADWYEYGYAAGPMRNKRMLDEGKPDLVIAFPGGKGTANMVKLAKAANIEVKEIQ